MSFLRVCEFEYKPRNCEYVDINVLLGNSAGNRGLIETLTSDDIPREVFITYISIIVTYWSIALVSRYIMKFVINTKE